MMDLASRLGVGGKPAPPPGFQALADISFEVRPGEVLGVIGENGSGKTTLLQIVAGILSPTEGRISTRGRKAALLELGSGFDPEFTGRENVQINGAILGLSDREILGRMDEILEFADIGDFADRPVKTYSAGMSLRLAFAVQACLSPDVLLVDEVLSVGDVFFQLKCHRRIEKLVSRGAALILVSHNMAQVEKYCGRVLVLDRGRCDFLGDPNVAVHRYLSRHGAAGGSLVPGSWTGGPGRGGRKLRCHLPKGPARTAFWTFPAPPYWVTRLRPVAWAWPCPIREAGRNAFSRSGRRPVSSWNSKPCRTWTCRSWPWPWSTATT